VQLGRALDNLILNAVQHTTAGGQILVSASHAEERLRLTVSDTGCGIPGNIEGQLFEPFVSGRTGGTGLGLAIAREIIEAHGGVIRLAPSAAGAVFEVDSPWRAS
jgi:two-component system sensor histidine kinase HydH